MCHRAIECYYKNTIYPLITQQKSHNHDTFRPKSINSIAHSIQISWRIRRSYGTRGHDTKASMQKREGHLLFSLAEIIQYSEVMLCLPTSIHTDVVQFSENEKMLRQLIQLVKSPQIKYMNFIQLTY